MLTGSAKQILDFISVNLIGKVNLAFGVLGYNCCQSSEKAWRQISSAENEMQWSYRLNATGGKEGRFVGWTTRQKRWSEILFSSAYVFSCGVNFSYDQEVLKEINDFLRC